MDYFLSVAWAIAPTTIVGLILWFALVSILRSDRRERAAQAKVEAQVEAEERARLAARRAG